MPMLIPDTYQSSYQKAILMYIEQEQMRLIEEADKAGISQGDIDKLIHSGNLSDYYIENAKIRLGIIE
jgi:hypothetical protein